MRSVGSAPRTPADGSDASADASRARGHSSSPVRPTLAEQACLLLSSGSDGGTQHWHACCQHPREECRWNNHDVESFERHEAPAEKNVAAMATCATALITATIPPV